MKRLVLLTTIALAALFSGSALAQKVANPGNYSFTFQSGTLAIGSQTFDAASSDDPITGSGTVAANGTVTITSLAFPTIPVDTGLGTATVTIEVQGNPSGTLNPLTGAMTLQVKVAIHITGGGITSSNCYVGTPASPITLNLTTGTTSPPGPNTPISGTPYDTSNGQVTIVDNSFAVPGATNCTAVFIDVTGTINGDLGLPSPAGHNSAILTAVSSPIAQKGVSAAFVASPSSGVAPLNVNFDGSSSFHVKPVTYQWDFDNNGSFDTSPSASPTTSHSYTVPGTYTAKLQVTDSDGDSATTTRQIIVSTPTPDLAITKSHVGDFVTGNTGTYTIHVSNVGTLATTGPVAVTDTLPGGMTYDSSAGDGWTCSAAGPVVACQNDSPVAPGDSLPDLSLTVAAATAGMVVNTASVATAGDPNASNNTAQDPTNVVQSGIDLAITKQVDQTDGLFRGHRATYILGVQNVGTLPSSGRIRVDDTLPNGLTFVSASGGLDWTCSNSGAAVHCFSDNVVAPGGSLHDINVRVSVDPDAASLITNDATVSTSGDSLDSNNTAENVGSVQGFAADYDLNMSHSGDFIVGEAGSYNLTVKNVGFATGDHSVTVFDQLPTGLEYDQASGDGWTCVTPSGDTQDVTCTHAGPVEAGDQLPGLTIQVRVHTEASPSVTNQAAVGSDDDFNSDNNTATDDTTVREPRPDLTITSSHTGNFVATHQGTYTLSVQNLATEPAHGPTTVTDTLPTGLTYVSAAGTNWVCSAAGQVVTCTYAPTVAGMTTAPAIALVVNVASNLRGTAVTNAAHVANADDTKAVNNDATDVTAVDAPQAAPTTLTATPLVLSLIGGNTGVSAQLLSNGHPVPGKNIMFNSLNGTFLCQVVTDANGWAKCTPSLSLLLKAALDLRYAARWFGDDSFAAAYDEGALIQGAKLKLL